jgi:DNA-directed RNA polymerase subunit RPC12/RpoP
MANKANVRDSRREADFNEGFTHGALAIRYSISARRTASSKGFWLSFGGGLREKTRVAVFDQSSGAFPITMKIHDAIQCPYCVEGNGFKVMTERADGHWFLCTHCGHVVIPEQPTYLCNCSHCAAMSRPLVSHSAAES